MTDNKPREPFQLLTDQDAPPRTGPTMAAIAGELGKLRALMEQVMRRQQQTALMVDGAAANMARRVEVLHTEVALLRATLARPVNDVDELPVTVEPDRRLRAKRLFVLGGRYTSYLTTAAVVLRPMVVRVFPGAEAFYELLGL